MADDIAIRAAGLGKKYVIGHQSERERYTTLRDVIDHGARNVLRTASDLLRGRAMVAGDTTEDVWALKDVDFEVKIGEVIGIIGRNGAGKSTLLKILSRITEPTQGRVEIRGRGASLLEVGTGFHSELTGRENIYLNGTILGMTRAEIRRKFDEIVAFAEVKKFLDTPVKRYSSGMYVRLAFAVAAHLEPEILIVDEVLAVGDAEFQKKCLGKMKEVAVGGRTVLFVSHNMNSVQTLCDRAIWLDKGRIRANSNEVRHVTLEYLSGGTGVARAEWVSDTEGAKDALVVPRAMRLIGAEGEVVSASVPNNTELTLELDVEVRRLDPALIIGYALYTEDGELLWWSYHSDEAPDRWPLIEKGNMRLRSALPRRLLNEGGYRIEYISGLYFRGWFAEPGTGVAAIHFEIQGGLSDSPHWIIAREGLLAPVLPWVRR
jgi:lipopolysaccharide transport system ATP-binding protein